MQNNQLSFNINLHGIAEGKFHSDEDAMAQIPTESDIIEVIVVLHKGIKINPKFEVVSVSNAQIEAI